MLTILLVVEVFSPAAPAWAFSTLDPWLDEAPTSLTVLGTDSFVGMTASGRQFTQYRIVSAPEIRLHKFVLGDKFFYISDRGVVSAQGDLEAISIYLALS